MNTYKTKKPIIGLRRRKGELRPGKVQMLSLGPITNRVPITSSPITNHPMASYQSPVANRPNLHPTPPISYPSAVLAFFPGRLGRATIPPLSRFPQMCYGPGNNYGITFLAYSITAGGGGVAHDLLSGGQIH